MPSKRTVEYEHLFTRAVKGAKGMTLDKFSPHPDYLVCQQLPPDEVTEGDIKIPDRAQVEKDYAVVLKVPQWGSIGLGHERPMDIESGDIVWFRNVGQEWMETADGIKIILLKFIGADDDAILGIFRGCDTEELLDTRDKQVYV